MNRPFYTESDLFPILSEVMMRYTKGESTSVSYDEAKQLMGSIIYALEAVRWESGLIAETSDFKMLYKVGLESRKAQFQSFRNAYHQLLKRFNAYGNECYEQTVREGLQGFMDWYDLEFNPTDLIITMDYPVIACLKDQQCLDKVQAYLEAINHENDFLGQIDPKVIQASLEHFHPNHSEYLINIASIICYNVMGCVICDRKGYTPYFDDDDRKYMTACIRRFSKTDFRHQSTSNFALGCQTYFGINEVSYFMRHIAVMSDAIWVHGQEGILNIHFK